MDAMIDDLAMWTVYDHPSDYPDHFVARQWLVDRRGGTRASGNLLTSVSLDGLRRVLARTGLTPIARSEDDDPKIVETWL